jgi:hypothetical protein
MIRESDLARLGRNLKFPGDHHDEVPERQAC